MRLSCPFSSGYTSNTTINSVNTNSVNTTNVNTNSNVNTTSVNTTRNIVSTMCIHSPATLHDHAFFFLPLLFLLGSASVSMAIDVTGTITIIDGRDDDAMMMIMMMDHDDDG